MKNIKFQIIKNLIFSLTINFQSILYIVRHPRTWFFIITPIVINIILTVLLFIISFKFLSGSIDKYLLRIELLAKFHFIITALKLFGGLIIFIINIWLFLTLAMIISAPFNGFITEKILDEYNIPNRVEFSGLKLIRFEIIRALKFEFQKIIVMILFFLFTSILHLVPVLGTSFFVIINYIFASYIILLDLQDGAIARFNVSFKEKNKSIFTNLDYYLPFGLYSNLILAIPILNFIYLPIAAISATFLFIENRYE